MSKISFQGCKLYCIIDRTALDGRDPVKVAEVAIRGGADVIQWRDKTASDLDFFRVASQLQKLTHRWKAIFIVNDRVDVALLSGADGVHLGHEDLPISLVRLLVGDKMLIGRSTHSLEEAKQAQASGADYIGVGPIFSTPTKPEYPPVGLDLIRQVRAQIQIPWVAIGGIDLSNIPLVISAGASRVAVVRAVAGAPDPKAAARAFKKAMGL